MVSTSGAGRLGGCPPARVTGAPDGRPDRALNPPDLLVRGRRSAGSYLQTSPLNSDGPKRFGRLSLERHAAPLRRAYLIDRDFDRLPADARAGPVAFQRQRTLRRHGPPP